MGISTERLILWVGVAKAQGDLLSAEQGAKSLMLITPGDQGGLKMELPNAWQPRRPGLKGGGVWSDSALSNGRTLLGDNVENVIETIVLQATDSDFQTLVQRMAYIQRIINDARQFLSTFHQIEPVFLEWSALGGFGSQYALIHNIDMDVQYDSLGAGGNPGSATVTLVIEREPAWRALPPGTSPRVWTKIWRGQSYDYTNIAFTDSGALFEATLNNRTEYDALSGATDGYNYPSVSKNWATIPKVDIPGDAPALAAVTIDLADLNSATDADVYVAMSSNPHELTASNGATRQRVYQINAVDATMTGGTQTTDNTNGVKAASSALIRVTRYTAPVGPSTTLWPNQGVFFWSLAMQRGKFALFMRGQRVSGAGDLTITPTIRSVNGRIELNTTVVTTPSSVTTPIYLGEITIPLNARTLMGADGTGQRVRANADMSQTDFDIDFSIAITLDGTLVFDFVDLVFVPLDESLILLKIGESASGVVAGGPYVIDSTGYLSRGQGTATLEQITGQTIFGDEFRGNELMLKPGVDNAIIVFVDKLQTGIVRTDYPVKVDIIPRCYGVRDF